MKKKAAGKKKAPMPKPPKPKKGKKGSAKKPYPGLVSGI